MQDLKQKLEQNWARNYSFGAGQIHRPSSVDEVRHLVSGLRKVRAIGMRHSFNGIADSSGDLIDLAGLAPDFAIDRERMTVTVSGSTSYGTLARYLHGQGFALHNMGSLPHFSVAGATATGTHGSGDKNGTLSTAIAGMELVLSDGNLIHVARGDEGLDGIVVGLGALGIVTRLTLDIQPTFDVRQDAFSGVSWDAILEKLDVVFATAYSVSVLTKWSDETVDRLWLKTRLVDGLPLQVTASHLGVGVAPVHVTTIGEDEPLANLNPFDGIPAPWSERLAHFRIDKEPGPVEQIQSEYLVPRCYALAALNAVRAIGARIDPYLWSSELRTVAADALWLSPAYGHDVLAIHFTWKRLPAIVSALTAEIEAILIPFGGRPHWGKIIHAKAATLAGLYPRLADFRNLADRYDPTGKFRNAFLEHHVFGGGQG